MIASAACAEDGSLPRVAWQDAGNFVGHRVCLEGLVVRVGHSRECDYLDFHRSSKQAATVAVPAAYRDRFPKSLEDAFRDRRVLVTGRVCRRETREGSRPVVYVTRVDQVRVVARGDEASAGGRQTEVTPRRQDRVLRVATFNVWNLMDGHDDPYTSDERAPAKTGGQLRQLAETLRTVDADVVALQEVESLGVLRAFLDRYLPDLGYDAQVLVEGNDPRGIDVALVSREPLGRVTSHAAWRWRDERGDAWRFTRDLLCVEVIPEGAAPLDVWVVHFRSNGDDPREAQRVRMFEARAVRERYEERLRREPGARILLAGDFNESREGPAMRTLLPDAEPRLTCLGEELPAARRVTYTRPNYRSTIDYLLASPALLDDYRAGSFRVLAGPDSGNGSDHNPVVAEFRGG